MKIKVRTEDGRVFNGMKLSVTEIKRGNRLPASIVIEADTGMKVEATGSVVTKDNTIVCEVLGDPVVPLFFKRMRRSGLEMASTSLRSVVLFGYDPNHHKVSYAVEVSPRGEIAEAHIDDSILAVAEKLISRDV